MPGVLVLVGVVTVLRLVAGLVGVVKLAGEPSAGADGLNGDGVGVGAKEACDVGAFGRGVVTGPVDASPWALNLANIILFPLPLGQQAHILCVTGRLARNCKHKHKGGTCVFTACTRTWDTYMMRDETATCTMYACNDLLEHVCMS